MIEARTLECVECRDRAILVSLAAGMTRQMIAKALYMSLSNVSFRVRIMCAQWSVSSSTALVAKAYVKGVLLVRQWPPVAAPHKEPHEIHVVRASTLTLTTSGASPRSFR